LHPCCLHLSGSALQTRQRSLAPSSGYRRGAACQGHSDRTCRGTILFTAHYPRLYPSDFRVRTLDGIADDWPIDYWTLEPYFAENDRMTGVAGLAGDPAHPPHQPTMPPVPLGRASVELRTRCRVRETMGTSWWRSYP
jgi:choline dehydrogenase-like flavoprotein